MVDFFQNSMLRPGSFLCLFQLISDAISSVIPPLPHDLTSYSIIPLLDEHCSVIFQSRPYDEQTCFDEMSNWHAIAMLAI